VDVTMNSKAEFLQLFLVPLVHLSLNLCQLFCVFKYNAWLLVVFQTGLLARLVNTVAVLLMRSLDCLFHFLNVVGMSVHFISPLVHTCNTPVLNGFPSSYRTATLSATKSAARVSAGSMIRSTHNRAAA